MSQTSCAVIYLGPELNSLVWKVRTGEYPIKQRSDPEPTPDSPDYAPEPTPDYAPEPTPDYAPEPTPEQDYDEAEDFEDYYDSFEDDSEFESEEDYFLE
ncbi:hypothetical protein LCGC14_2495420 [marine sediment metagenome]|uniref:Uncharacterized protein n=2 Tax=root TaxID=1 RepID=A0A0F8VB42_9ZZZZ|nr:MAG: hypothetical protein LCMAC202_05920 [Marseillevirus LCMAC202]